MARFTALISLKIRHFSPRRSISCNAVGRQLVHFYFILLSPGSGPSAYFQLIGVRPMPFRHLVRWMRTRALSHRQCAKSSIQSIGGNIGEQWWYWIYSRRHGNPDVGWNSVWFWTGVSISNVPSIRGSAFGKMKFPAVIRLKLTGCSWTYFIRQRLSGHGWLQDHAFAGRYSWRCTWVLPFLLAGLCFPLFSPSSDWTAWLSANG